jgi:hypothetical protein
MLSHQWKSSVIVIKTCVAPAAGTVTGAAIRAKLSVMLIITSVTGKAAGGRAFIYIIHVARCAWRVGVPPRKWKRSVVVIENHIGPTGRFMT